MIISLVSIGLVLCILLSAFFSASEMAFSACNTVRLENMTEEKAKGWRKARTALRITENFDNALSAILIGNNLVNIASSSLASVLVILIMDSDRYTWIATIILTVLVIIFGETIPKISAKKNFYVYVVPYKIIDGKAVKLGKSTVAHVVGAKNAKYSNVKKLTLKKSKYSGIDQPKCQSKECAYCEHHDSVVDELAPCRPNDFLKFLSHSAEICEKSAAFLVFLSHFLLHLQV